MFLHFLIRQIIRKYGKEIVSGKRLFNILNDINAFKYELKPIKFIFCEVLTRYGKKITDQHINSLPISTTVNQYVHDMTVQCGFNEDMVRYAIESLAYGVELLDKTNNIYDELMLSENKFKFFAYFYHILGINITQISGSLKYDKEKREEAYMVGEMYLKDSFKEPIEGNWKEYIRTEQSKNYIETLDWEGKTGIGMICGYNNIRVIDIDDILCHDDADDFIQQCLSLLNLPSDYQWVVRTGSGVGIHIIIKCEDVEDMDLGVTAFGPSNYAEKFGLYKVELYWKGHIASVPSVGKYYEGTYENAPFEPNPYKYDFINCDTPFPGYEPQWVSINNLNNLLLKLCGEVRCESLEYIEEAGRFSSFYNYLKFTNRRSSMGEYNKFTDSLMWLKKCNSPNGLNSLGVWYIKNKQYKNAYNYFIKSDTDLSHFNIIEMMRLGYIPFSKGELIEHFNKCKNSKCIYEYMLNEIKKIVLS